MADFFTPVTLLVLYILCFHWPDLTKIERYYFLLASMRCDRSSLDPSSAGAGCYYLHYCLSDCTPRAAAIDIDPYRGRIDTDCARDLSDTCKQHNYSSRIRHLPRWIDIAACQHDRVRAGQELSSGGVPCCRL